MLHHTPTPSWRDFLAADYRRDEDAVVTERVAAARINDPQRQEQIRQRARSLIQSVRDNRLRKGGVDALMHEYDLSTQEGLVLMCLAEALLRIPDSDTADALIRDKLAGTDWEKHLGNSSSIFVNASTIGLMLTGRILGKGDLPTDAPNGVMRRLVSRLGEPVIRQALRQAMRIMGKQFVLGRTMAEAMERGADSEKRGYRYSFDMLGEAARTEEDAQKYYVSYEQAIHAIGKASNGRGVIAGPGISVKLSALYPRYEVAKREQVLDILTRRTLELAKIAKAYDIGFCVDAEEAERLELSLEVMEAVYGNPALDGWTGFGLAIQAYSKRTYKLIDVLAEMSKRVGRRMNVRLVKGAYWDAEIKRAQDLGLPDYPVYTRKVSTDVSYMACARKLFDYGDLFFPQFATHNALTVATILELSQGRPFEFQRLHGMGEELYDEITPADKLGIACRIYAPVGGHAELLSYLVRRLLENGSNSSFVNRLVDDKTPIEDIIADPVTRVAALASKRHPHIPMPKALYGQQRRNSSGLDLSDSLLNERLLADLTAHAQTQPKAGPIINGVERTAGAKAVLSPADRDTLVGYAAEATVDEAKAAMAAAQAAFPAWSATSAEDRAATLERAADALEARMTEFMSLCLREAGKTLPDGVAEVREAVDFLRYYAIEARKQAAAGLKGRGVFVCISPWNFPLAIFTGQVVAALVVGNTVVAKPAEQTTLVAAAMVRLLHDAGIPTGALQLVPGLGETVGAALVSDERVAGIAFTGSVEVAHILNRTLARRGQSIPLIAETGGLNAMIVDSSALPEQVIRDAVLSAFGSAGQRCSALRVMYVQTDVADGIMKMLKGAMEELRVGDPARLDTDVGPVIDAPALEALEKHAQRMDREARLIATSPLSSDARNGTFFAPRAYEISNLKALPHEVFGPILHVVRYQTSELPAILREVRDTGYGLTMGIHTRIDANARRIQAASAVGNTYVNRSMIGAVVGVQPFGGEGLSGTGPKAGGPNYLTRFGRFAEQVAPQAQAGTDLAQQAARVVASSLPAALTPASSAALGRAAEALALHAPARPAALEARVALVQSLLSALSSQAATVAATLLRDGGAVSAEQAAQQVALSLDGLNRLQAQTLEETAKPLALPGPTGERNEMSVHPRGVVAVVAAQNGSFSGFVLRVAAALAGGNRVVAAGVASLASALSALLKTAAVPGDLATVHAANQEELCALLSSLDLQAAGLEGDLPQAVATLAARPRAIIPLDSDPVSPATLHRYLVERSRSVDMTAAGGNASLLMLNEDAPAAQAAA